MGSGQSGVESGGIHAIISCTCLAFPALQLVTASLQPGQLCMVYPYTLAKGNRGPSDWELGLSFSQRIISAWDDDTHEGDSFCFLQNTRYHSYCSVVCSLYSGVWTLE